MSIEVYIPPSLQGQIANVKLVKVEGKTVGECLVALIACYPQLASSLLKDGKIHKGLSLFVNSENAHPQGLNKPIHDGDKLYIMNILVGG